MTAASPDGTSDAALATLEYYEHRLRHHKNGYHFPAYFASNTYRDACASNAAATSSDGALEKIDATE